MDQNTAYTASQNALKYYKGIWAKDVFTEWGHLWAKANQAHSYLRFAEVASKCYPTLVNPSTDLDWYVLMKDPQNLFFGDLWNAITSATDTPRFWVDDYGWCGLACIKVAETYRNLNFVPPSDSNGHTWMEWRDKAFICMQLMFKAAQSSASQGGSPVANGLSNQPIVDPSGFYLKNTVTNALYFLLPMTLYDWCKQYPSDSPAPAISNAGLLQIAWMQYSWFRDWFAVKPNAPPGVWNKGIPFNYYHRQTPNLRNYFALIEDRPVAFDPDTYDPEGVVEWSPDGVWSGDQGLMLAAMALFYIYAQDLHEVLFMPQTTVTEVQDNIKQWFLEVARGVWLYLCSDTANNPAGDFVLREAPFSFTFGTEYVIDYMCGRAVLARFFSLEKTKSVWQQFVAKPYSALFDKCFATTAQVIDSTSGGEPAQLSARWNGGAPDEVANAFFFTKFGTVEGKTVTDFDFSWDESASPRWGPNEGGEYEWWNNYCMMSGFDLYAAFLRTTSWYPQETEEKSVNSHKSSHIGSSECKHGKHDI
jgi:hypothetical protein